MLTTGMRRMLWLAAALVLAQALPLTLRSGRTDRYFAWTIDVPVTAAFLGVAYLAAGVLEASAAKQATWSGARLAVPGVWLFTTLTLLVTVVHLDRFHLDAASLMTRSVTWGWVVVYATVPVILGVLWWRQASRRGGDHGPANPLPPPLRHSLGAQGLAMSGAGSLLLLRPDASAWWPWPLTVLTAQAVGAWLLGLGAVALQAWWTDRQDAAAVVFPAAVVFALGQLAVVVRFADGLRWDDAAAWTYSAFLAGLVAVGLAGTLAARRPAPARPAGRPARGL